MARREERYYQVIDRLYDTLKANSRIKSTKKGLRACANRNGYTQYARIDDYNVALMYDRNAWMSKSSVETPFWFYIVDSIEWKQSDHLKAILRTIPENEREMLGNYIGVALYAPLDSELDEIAVNMMNQIIGFIDKVRNTDSTIL